MATRYYIAFFTSMFVFTVHVNAQHMMGGVVIHSDPRLAVLLQKNPVSAPPVSDGPPPPTAPEATRKAHPHDKAPLATSRIADVSAHRVWGSPVHTASETHAHTAPVAAVRPAATPAAIHTAPAPAPHAHAAPMPVPVAPARPAGVSLSHKDGKVLYTGKGFRVQIYNGADREKAIKVKTEFSRLYPGIHTYLTYVSPCFRVKVGDYRSRPEAERMLRETASMYESPSMIVPDNIAIHANN